VVLHRVSTLNLRPWAAPPYHTQPALVGSTQVRDATRKNRVGAPPVFGRVQLHVAAAKDGSTLMWCRGPNDQPLALRCAAAGQG